MATTHDIHNDIESWLAAAVHDQLSPEERADFDEHLANCETCRALHEEELTMSNMIENTLSQARPDLAFEQRIVWGFRRNVPTRRSFTAPFANFFRWRATQLAAVAAVLLTLVQVGRLVTDEGLAPVERLRQLPSFRGSTAGENDSRGDQSGARGAYCARRHRTRRGDRFLHSSGGNRIGLAGNSRPRRCDRPAGENSRRAAACSGSDGTAR